MRTWLLRIGLGGIAVLGLLQVVPYGRWHENPRVVQDAPWPDAATAELARGACYDCHSNETEWPAYSYVAPVSWLVRRDVEEGRERLNFSEWGGEGAGEVDDAAEEVEEGSMPPRKYELLHPDARLSDDEVAQLVAALEQLEAAEGGADDGDRRGRGRGGDDEPGDDGDDDDGGD